MSRSKKAGGGLQPPSEGHTAKDKTTIRPDPRALAGMTVFEIGHSVAAPFAGLILGALGADVIKIENPGRGDDARGWGPPFWHGAAATFQTLNRDKKSVAVNLKDPKQRQLLQDAIVMRGDVVLQNLRPGLAKELGFGPDLRKRNPRLIYCSIGAFGPRGPMSEKPGYDPLMQAFAGIMSVTGEEGRAPVRVGPSIVDMAAGMWAVIGTLAALNRRAQSGQGCEVDTSLYETSLAWMTVPAALYCASGDVPGRSGSEAAMIVPYKAYEASDGYLVIAAGNDNLFRRLCKVLGHPEWAEDRRFATNSCRVENRLLVNQMIETVVHRMPTRHWLTLFEDAGVPVAPIQTIDQVLDHPQTVALEMLQPSPTGRFHFMGLPLSFDGLRPPLLRDPPSLGEQNTLLDELKEQVDAH